MHVVSLVLFPPKTEVKTNYTRTLCSMYGIDFILSSVYLSMLLAYEHRTTGNTDYVFWEYDLVKAKNENIGNGDIFELTYDDLESEYNFRLNNSTTGNNQAILKSLQRLLRLHKKGFIICAV